MELAKKLMERGFRLGGNRRMAEKFPGVVVVNDYSPECST